MRTAFVFLLCGILVGVEAKVTVISTLCQKEEEDGKLRWLKCPTEASERSSSTREFLDNLNTEDEEQKFCCGDVRNRFCCSFAEKLREVPSFDPSAHYDASVRYRFRHEGHFHFWHYLFFFALTFLFFAAVSYIFGCIIFEVLYCIFCCCRSKKKTNDLEDAKNKKSRRNPYPDQSTVMISPNGRILDRPPNYQSIRQPYNFGGSSDLYQDVTPPTYFEAASEANQQPLNMHV